MNSEKILKFVGLWIITAALLSVCFAPSTLAFTRLENFAIPIILVILLASKKIRIELPYFLALAAFFGFYIVTMFLNGEGMSDVSFAFRTLKILLFLILGAQLLHEHLPSLDQIIRGTFLLIASIIMLEFFNPMGIYEVLFGFFTHHLMGKFERLDSIRIIGTMVNPNDNGVLLTCFIAYFMSAFYYSKNKWNFVFIAVGIWLIIISQSRTALIAVLAIGVPFLLTFRITKTMVLSVLGSALIVIVAMYLLEMNYMMELLTKNPLKINEFQGRLPSWGYMMEVWSEHKIWGVGPFADTFTTHIIPAPDNEYLYILSSRGIIGLVCYIFILFYPMIIFWIKRKEVKHGLLAVLLSVAFALIGITNFSILNVRIGVLYGILMAIPFSYLLYKGEDNKLNLDLPSFGSLFAKSK